MTNRILGHELQQRWIVKVVPTFEDDALMHEIRILLQVAAQACYVAGIDKFHAPAKYCVFDTLMVRQIQSVWQRGLFNMPFQSCPTRKSGLACNGELRIAKANVGIEDFGVTYTAEARMKFSDPLRRS